jgi:hypothetical protein
MAFTAGIKSQKQYTENSQQNKNTFDRIVTITDYDTAKGYIYAEDDEKRKYEIFVNPEEVRRSNESIKNRGVDTSKINWMGHSIDEKMKKSIPVGSKIILIRSNIKKNDKTRGIYQTEVHRIIGVPAPEKDKTFQGLFTMNYRVEEGKQRISRVQHWAETGVDINNEDGVNNLKAKIDKQRENFGKKMGEFSITEPVVGIQFRALMKTDKLYEYEKDPAKQAIFEVVDMSRPFDWIPGPEDENGNEIKAQAHVITGDEMAQFADKYIEYITNNPNFKDHIENMRIEICHYNVYPASKNDSLLLTTGNQEKDLNADKNPLYQLSHRKNFIDLEQTETEYLIGKNAAVNGIIQLSSNKLERVDGKPAEIPNYWVTKLHANNTRGHVHAFIRTEDGHKTTPHPSLAFVKDADFKPKDDVPAQEEKHVIPATNSLADSPFDPFLQDDAPTALAKEAAPATQTNAKQPPKFGKKST